ncbi:exocyst complex component EXO70H1-like [Cucurbita maxima]|uniref:Exocyst subunit Exo70 family protein n=1 Tax=Cucurbita maxima TaxID=3661 RepID=A0A6J1KHD6_CUCMA|nr:exocyst complex component EXO70H1-like [Cucurbita maxima]
MRNHFFRSLTPSHSPARTTPSHSPTRSTPSRSSAPTTPSHALSESLMEENIDVAEILITKWDRAISSYADITPLFQEDGYEAKQYLKAVKDLQTAMKYFGSENMKSRHLVRAQNLMQTAMKRLQREFHRILSDNRAHLDPESISNRSSRDSGLTGNSDLEDESEDDLRFANEDVTEEERISRSVIADLKSIAEGMISAGYSKECVKIYTVTRKSIVEEGLYNLGVAKTSYHHVHRMEWEVLEVKIKNWLNAVKIAVKNFFEPEKFLCDQVFSISDMIRESVFSEITRESALTLFGFPEMAVKSKKTPEKIFLILNLYEVIFDLLPEIESMFSCESTSSIRSLIDHSLTKIAESIRSMLVDFESHIQKDSSKTPVPSGGVHPLTRYVMNYISFLSDYSGILPGIVADWPLMLHSPLPESFFGGNDSEENPLTIRLAWIILVLLSKLDSKAELYLDAPLSYIFLANNLKYIVVKARTSNLRFLLGDEWIESHEAKVKQYASSYQRMGWSRVFLSLPENPTADISPERARKHFHDFNIAFEEAYRHQASWIVTDSKLREHIKISLGKKLGTLYGEFYIKYRSRLEKLFGCDSEVRFAPDDLGNYLSDLLHGDGNLGGSVSSSSSLSSSPYHFHGGRRSG